MTEEEWQTCSDWIMMWSTLHDLGFGDDSLDRKRRLVATEICHRLLPHLSDPRLRRLIELSWERVEGRIKDENQWDEWEDACDDASSAASACRSAIEVAAAWIVAGLKNDDHKIGRTIEGVPYYFGCLAGIDAGILNRDSSVEEAQTLQSHPVIVAGREVHGPRLIAKFIRDIFGNPFRPVSFDPEWRTSTLVSLARSMYDSRDFSPMPIISDALQDAGCEHEDILYHCRDANGVHVRGCWVVDLVLGKT